MGPSEWSGIQSATNCVNSSNGMTWTSSKRTLTSSKRESAEKMSVIESALQYLVKDLDGDVEGVFEMPHGHVMSHAEFAAPSGAGVCAALHE